jgi:Ni/Fe-hydrogenase subunit HybB-like protein
LAIWYFWAKNLRQASVDQDTMETSEFKYYRIQRKWAASFLPLGGFLSTVFLWQSVMSIDSHWYSTMFAWYSMVSMWLGAISMTVMLIIYLKSLGYLEYVTQNHLHDIGKFLFGISVFWTYLWFDQFMLIWYANNGEETIYFNERMTHYPVLFWGNLLLNFVTPFLILMRNDTKRKFGTMFFVALIVFFGHWWDYFYMIKPGARISAHEAMELAEGKHGDSHSSVAPGKHEDAHPVATEATAASGGDHGDGHGADGHHAVDESKAFKLGYTLPGLEELGILIGFVCLFLFFFFNQLSKVSLVPLKDPFLEESLHHDTGALIESEGGGHDHH